MTLPRSREKTDNPESDRRKYKLTGNDILLYRAVYNLVENAIKNNRPGGTVTVDIQNISHQIILTISDSGIGISPENHLYSLFPCCKSRSCAIGGAGLGLALVCEIAEFHGGDVRILNSSSHGTDIVFSSTKVVNNY